MVIKLLGQLVGLLTVRSICISLFTRVLSINLFICFFISFSISNGQNEFLDQSEVDSLKKVYSSISLRQNNVIILSEIAMNENNPDEKLLYSELLIDIAIKDSLFEYVEIGYLQKGNSLQLKGEYHEALSAYFECLELADRKSNIEMLPNLLVSIADTYSMIGNSDSAEKYYDEAIVLLRKENDSLNLATALLNSGDEYYKTDQYKRALTNFEESGIIFKRLDFPVGIAYNKGNIGMVYAKQDKHELAKTNIYEAINILEENEDYYAISVYLNSMSDIYLEQADYATALAYAQRSLDLATQYNLKDQISEANLQLSELMEESGNYMEALERYKTHDIYQDSIMNLDNVQKMANLEIEKKDLEVENLEQKRKTQRIILWSVVGILLLIGIIAYGLFKSNNYIKETNKIIAAEQERSDNLLLNILPEETAHELKHKGTVEAKKFEAVTVLFSDFKGFTHYAENLPPEILVKTVDHYFSAFDLIMEKHGLEKIKTVGDAYMAAGGLPFETEDHAKKMVEAAKEMSDFVAKAKHDDKTNATFDIRIGINTGPVVAGVVGTKKFAYDIWGDTVNIAARMESASEPGKINISESTYQRINSDYACDYRGEISVKNRGNLKMYYVSGTNS